MPFRIVNQQVKVKVGQDFILELAAFKVIGNAPNDARKADRDGTVREFLSIPPIIRLYLGNDKWPGSPEVMPTYEEMAEIPENERPIVWTITLNPRNGNFNLHFGLGKGTRIDVDHKSNFRKVVNLDPVCGSVGTFAAKLTAIIKDSDLASAIVDGFLAEMVALHAAIAKSKAAKAAKPAKPRKVKELDITPEQSRRNVDKAEIDARRNQRADVVFQERIDAERRRVA